MWSIVAREVNFSMAVAFMISAEQRAIKIVVSTDKTLLGYLLEHTRLVAFRSTALVARLGASLGRCLKSALNSI